MSVIPRSAPTRELRHRSARRRLGERHGVGISPCRSAPRGPPWGPTMSSWVPSFLSRPGRADGDLVLGAADLVLRAPRVVDLGGGIDLLVGHAAGPRWGIRRRRASRASAPTALRISRALLFGGVHLCLLELRNDRHHHGRRDEAHDRDDDQHLDQASRRALPRATPAGDAAHPSEPGQPLRRFPIRLARISILSCSLVRWSFDAIEPAGSPSGPSDDEVVGDASRRLGHTSRSGRPHASSGSSFEVARGLELLELLRALAVVIGAVGVDRPPDDEKSRARRALAGALPLAHPEEHDHARDAPSAEDERASPREPEAPQIPPRRSHGR